MASKAMIWTGRVISALPVLVMVAGFSSSLFKPEMVTKVLGELGFSSNLTLPIGILEMVCVAVYLIPPTTVLGAILLTGYFGGATACHLRVGQPFFVPVVFGVLVWLGLFLRDAKIRTLIPFRR
jgi:hypothetical protein